MNQRLTDILKLHPTPWRHQAAHGGIIVVIDANGANVDLFTMLDFIKLVTEGMARRNSQEATPSDDYNESVTTDSQKAP